MSCNDTNYPPKNAQTRVQILKIAYKFCIYILHCSLHIINRKEAPLSILQFLANIIFYTMQYCVIHCSTYRYYISRLTYKDCLAYFFLSTICLFSKGFKQISSDCDGSRRRQTSVDDILSVVPLHRTSRAKPIIDCPKIPR